jgi:hypothetical protein
MSFVDFKEVNIANPGTSTKYGSNDLLEVMKILNGKVVSQRQVRILNPLQFVDHVEIKAPATLPASPSAANIRHICVDPADNHLKIQKTGGTMIDIDTLVANTWNSAASETLTNKTMQVDLNTLAHSTTNAIGDILKNTGTKFNRFAKGTALQLLRVNAGATDLEWADPAIVAGGGEINTTSNVGTAGVGVFKQKTGVNFELKKLFAVSSNISVVDDVANNKINLDVNLGSIALGSLAGTINLSSQVTGTLGVANGGTGVSSITGLVRGSGTGAFSGIANGAANQVLTMIGGLPAWAALPSAGTSSSFMPDVTKWGGFWGGATSGTGILGGAVGYGNSITGDQSSSTDNFTTFTTDSSDASTAGFKTLCSVTRRSYTPVVNYRFKIGDNSNTRVWMGLSTESTVAVNAGGDDPLSGGASGLMFGYSDIHSSFQITYAQSGSSSTFISTVPKNTAVHDLQLEFDNVAGKIKVTLDGTVYTPAGTSNTPSTTTPLFLHFNIEAIGSNARQISVNYCKIAASD